MTTGKTCSVEGCDREVASRGMCNAHYIRWRRYGDPLGGPTPRAVKICSTRGCGRRARAKGLCSTHYAQARADRDPRLNVSLCSVEGCGANVDSRGLCNRHRIRAQRHGDPGARLTAETPEDAFRMYVEREGDCHVWTGTRYANGYGRVKRDGKAIRAHRYAWERENGPIPDGMVVRHKCDNPPCVNPDHLEVGTHQDNVDDMIARGRAAWQKAG